MSQPEQLRDEKWVMPFASREALVDHLSRVMRDRAYPEFTAAPPPLWARDAAETVAAFYEGVARAAITYGGADRAHRLLNSALRWMKWLEEPDPKTRDAWIAAAEDEMGGSDDPA